METVSNSERTFCRKWSTYKDDLRQRWTRYFRKTRLQPAGNTSPWCSVMYCSLLIAQGTVNDSSPQCNLGRCDRCSESCRSCLRGGLSKLSALWNGRKSPSGFNCNLVLSHRAGETFNSPVALAEQRSRGKLPQPGTASRDFAKHMIACGGYNLVGVTSSKFSRLLCRNWSVESSKGGVCCRAPRPLVPINAFNNAHRKSQLDADLYSEAVVP